MPAGVKGTSCGLIIFIYLHGFSASNVFPHPEASQRPGGNQNSDSSEEARLIRDLLLRYKTHGKFSRPLLSTGKGTAPDGVKESKVYVRFGLRLMHVDLSEKDQVMKTSVWIRVQWYDEYLRWNRSNYSGITRVTLPYDFIWHPDIVLVNTAEAEVTERLPSVQVTSTGSVFWTPHAQFVSACLLDITKYPFDRHVCDMWFQSIAHSSTKLVLKPYHTSSHNTSFDLSTYFDSYKSSQAWLIINNMTDLFERPRDEGMMLMYSRRPALRFRLILQRRSGFQSYLLTVPCIVLSILVPLVFCLPPERPDRHIIAMSLFASSLVLLLILATEAPPSAASTPTLCLYYGYNMLAIMASIFCSVLVITISQKGAYGVPVPHAVHKIFNQRLAYFLRVRRPPGHVLLGPVPKPNENHSGHEVIHQWKFLASVIDRLFSALFFIFGVMALVLLYPWR